MDKETLLACWDKEYWGIKDNEIRTGIPYPYRKWEPVVSFFDFEEQELCDILDVEFMKNLREKLPELAKKACELAKEHNYWHLKFEDLCGIRFQKNDDKSFFMLEFNGGKNYDKFQEEWMVYIGFDRNFNFTGALDSESIWT